MLSEDAARFVLEQEGGKDEHQVDYWTAQDFGAAMTQLRLAASRVSATAKSRIAGGSA